MDWLPHDGTGCPVSPGEIVETIDSLGESHIGPACCSFNVDEYGSSWEWCEISAGHEIIAYRICKAEMPVSLMIDQEMLPA